MHIRLSKFITMSKSKSILILNNCAKINLHYIFYYLHKLSYNPLTHINNSKYNVLLIVHCIYLSHIQVANLNRVKQQQCFFKSGNPKKQNKTTKEIILVPSGSTTLQRAAINQTRERKINKFSKKHNVLLLPS